MRERLHSLGVVVNLENAGTDELLVMRERAMIKVANAYADIDAIDKIVHLRFTGGEDDGSEYQANQPQDTEIDAESPSIPLFTSTNEPTY